jgi:pimeloyl-ACP methyl ester carboxylesterase
MATKPAIPVQHTTYVNRPEGRIGYDDVEAAEDVVALIGALGGPAVVIGNSMAAGSATLVAAKLHAGRRPDDFDEYRRQVMVPEAGHHPQSQRPDVTSGAVRPFLATAQPTGSEQR